jgi:hypothetical protein
VRRGLHGSFYWSFAYAVPLLEGVGCKAHISEENYTHTSNFEGQTKSIGNLCFRHVFAISSKFAKKIGQDLLNELNGFISSLYIDRYKTSLARRQSMINIYKLALYT